ncbi:MAG: SDR family oxidoreductase [Candidatus Omnitrophica bacterium]|nr:SDR family oxidoreductase [Candidatus Omnitrophota bacterium]
MKVLVVGGSQGIGASLVRRLRAGNHSVTFTYCRHEKEAGQLASSTGAERVLYDFHSAESIQKLARVAEDGGFDGFVYCAAQLYAREALLKMETAVFMEYVTTGIRGVFEVSRAFASGIQKRKARGSIVHLLSSVVLAAAPEKQGAYVALKYLHWGLARSQAAEFSKYGIRVNAVSPGMTRTDFNADLPARFIETVEYGLPMGRIAEPDEVAAAIQFLLSPESSYMNDVNLPVTGG